jgi:hypothetical protein
LFGSATERFEVDHPGVGELKTNIKISFFPVFSRSPSQTSTYQPVQPPLFPNNLPDEPLQVLGLGHINLDPYDSGLMSGLFDEVDKARKVFLEEITGVDGLGACGGVLKNGGSADSGGGASACKVRSEGIRLDSGVDMLRNT